MIAYIAVFISLDPPFCLQSEQNKYLPDWFYEIYRINILSGFYNLSYQIRNFCFIAYFGFKFIGATFDKIQLFRNI